MKSKMICILSISVCCLFLSCEKEPVYPESPAEVLPAFDYKPFLKNIKSDNEAEYYISGEFDGYKIYCASTMAELYPANDTVMNAIYENAGIGLDNIHLLRQNRDMSVMIAIYFDKAKIYTRKFPYILPHPNLELCEAAQIDILDKKGLGTAGQGFSQDDFSYWGTTNRSVKVQVTSLLNDIIEGTFEGTLTAKNGYTIIVKNGQFRLKVINVTSGK